MVLGRIAYVLAMLVALPQIATWAFSLAAVAHLAGQGAARIASRREADAGRRVALLALWLGPALVLGSFTVRGFDLLGFGGILTAMLTWIIASSRGIAAVTQPTGTDGVRRGLVSGTVILGSMSLAGRGGAARIAEMVAFLFLCSALLVLRRRREVTERVFVQERAPWAVGGAVFLIVVLVAVLGVYAVGTGGFATFVKAIAAVWNLAALALGYAMVPLAYLVQWLINLLQRVFAGRETEGLQMPDSLAGRLAERVQENPEVVEAPVWLKWGGVALALACVAWIAWLIISRFHRAAQGQSIQETRESLVERGAVKEWLDGIAGGIVGLAAGALSGLLSLVGRESESLEEIYRATLVLLAGRGIPRAPHVTPYEYRGYASEEMPDDGTRDALGTITQVFTECYYSERVPAPAELKAMREAYRLLAGSSFRATPAPGHEGARGGG